jgi:hypothetical protein
MTEKTVDPYVPDQLRAKAAIYEERNKLYGDNYKRFGPIMALLFPNGLTLATGDDHNRFGVFVQIVAKVTRYAEQFQAGGHDDSLDDTAVYSMMLKQLDNDLRSKTAEATTAATTAAASDVDKAAEEVKQAAAVASSANGTVADKVDALQDALDNSPQVSDDLLQEPNSSEPPKVLEPTV